MRVREWMSPDPVTVSPSTSVREARHLMRYYGVRHLPVVDHDRVVGMLSDRDVRIDDSALDLIAAAAAEADDATGASREVRLVMSAPVHVIGPDEAVEAAARAMLSWRVSALPVVNGEDHLLGLITTTDCLLASLSPAARVASEGG
jgi:acetoin utilization protein AcuB